MNSRDSEFIAGLFVKRDYKLTDSTAKADIILFNTCSVRGHAEDRAISAMRQLMHKYKKRIYGMIGCAAQNLKDKLFEKLPDLDIVCGTGEITRLPELVQEAEKNKVLALGNLDAPLPEKEAIYRDNPKHAYVSIMRGCNNYCSYCVVPYVRGKERSRKINDIIKEVKSLLKKDIREITFLGQNVNSYKDGTISFVELLKKVNEIKDIKKISFMTSHPKDATLKLFEAIKNLDKVVKHLHLPIQSGSDRILHLMNRGYASKKYLQLVKEARDIIPDLRLTTDIIVGFPGETKKDFQDTLNLMKNVKFNQAYIFKYSSRSGTKAAKMEDSVSDEEKKRRHKIILDLQKELSKRKKHAKNNCFCIH